MKVLVTGYGGFLGSAIAKQLLARGDRVIGVARTRYPELEKAGVEAIQTDLNNLEAMQDATRGCDAVIHCAAKAGAWGDLHDYYSSNVSGTDRLLAACFMNDVPRLVFTSTPSVVHAGGDLEGVDERTPIAEHFSAHYPATKAIAEQRVLKANGPGLATVALRPHLIYGPGDPQLMPRIVERARAGRLAFVGKVPKKIDVTYIDDAAHAHLNALDRLAPGSPCAGRAYFISSGEPILLDDMINGMLRAASLPPVTRRIPLPLANVLASGCELTWRLLKREDEPPLTKFVVEQLSTAHWYNIAAAKRDLGYHPRVMVHEGLLRLSEWWMRRR